MADGIGTRNPRTIKIKAFSLIELLTVISIILLLIAIILPALAASKAHNKQLICQSNLRQLVLANIGYAAENSGNYVAAASDFFGDNLHRWYGTRDNSSHSFISAKGPLASYLGQNYIKCPVKVNYKKLNPSEFDYDEGSGGYGYNMIYIGSRIWNYGYEEPGCKVTAKDTEISQPVQTLMFADTAMAKSHSYIEYSFAEPRYFVVNGEPFNDPGWNPSPSIHFRHRGRANIGWVDGHISPAKMGKYNGKNLDGTRPQNLGLGWFEPMDNTQFDLK